ncbi:MAG: NAD(P)-dependent oxidoreductase [Azospirillaceae bacterium]
MILVTGATGFIGTGVLARLAASGRAWVGVGRQRALRGACRGAERTITPFHWDLSNLAALLEAVRPAAVIHLAGSAVAFDAPRIDGHVAALEELLAACQSTGQRPRIVFASSAAVYGTRPRAVRLNASSPTSAQGAYGRAKLACEARLGQVADAEGMQAVAARIFNATGPGQRSGLLVDILDQIDLSAPRGTPLRLTLRNQASHRDFVDIRDVGRCLIALADAAEAPKGTVVNVCSGRGTSVRAVVEIVADLLGRPADVRVSCPETEPDFSIGDAAACLKLLARPPIPLRRSIADAIAARRSRPT